MIRPATKNFVGGFFFTLAMARGQPMAEAEYAKAFETILREWARRSTSGIWREDTFQEQIIYFLDSDYGTKVAECVLKKVPVSQQLDERWARFMRHFSETSNQFWKEKEDDFHPNF